MLHYFRNPLVYLVPVAMLLASCATTQLTSVWKDPSYQSRPAKILVIGLSSPKKLGNIGQELQTCNQ